MRRRLSLVMFQRHNPTDVAHNPAPSSHKGGNNYSLLIAGIAAGILGSRLLPPIVASINGARQARSTGDPFEVLLEDHRKIRSLLDQMEQAPTQSSARRGALFLMLKRTLGKHAMAEEDVVYPILHGQAQDQEGSKDLYEDHADIKIHLFEIEEALMNGEDWNEQVRSLRTLVTSHIEEEEQNVFPRLRALLDEQKSPKVSGQIRREEALLL